jgi:hypothetical protein
LARSVEVSSSAPSDLNAPTVVARSPDRATPQDRRSPSSSEPSASATEEPGRLTPVLTHLGSPRPSANGPKRADAEPLLPDSEDAIDIQITIGRVEVRAVPPKPAEPRKQPEPAPRASLKSYLQRRRGGPHE